MQIILNANNYIIGYTTIGNTVGGIDVDNIPEEVKQNPFCYKYNKGEYVFDDSYIKKEQEKETAQKEYDSIIKWMQDTIHIPLAVLTGEMETDSQDYIDYFAEYTIKKQRKQDLEKYLNIDDSNKQLNQIRR